MMLGADKAYDVTVFVQAMRRRRVTQHIAADRKVRKAGVALRSEIDGRTTRYAYYEISRRIGEMFGCTMSAAGLRQTKPRGADRVGWSRGLMATTYNLIGLPRLPAQAG